MSTTPGDLCKVCGMPRDPHNYRHAFVPFDSSNGALHPAAQGSDASSSAPTSDKGSLGNALKGDPVLRIALMRKGIITADDLASIEAELRTSGIAWDSSPPVG